MCMKNEIISSKNIVWIITVIDVIKCFISFLLNYNNISHLKTYQSIFDWYFSIMVLLTKVNTF